MRFLALVTAVAAGLWTASAFGQALPAAPERRVALVIGNDAYAELPRLRNARRDAQDIAAKLEKLGFDTILRLDVARRPFNQALVEFGDKIAAGAVGLVFYAGHGLQVAGENYLVPIDALLETEADVPGEGIPLSRILALMDDQQGRMNVVILDACRDNPLPRRSRGVPRGLAQVNAPTGTFVAFSAAPGQAAQDGPPGSNGPFTGELLQVIDQPGLKIEDVFKRVTAGVKQRTRDRQVPWIQASLLGDFYFVAPPPALPAPPPVVQGSQPPAAEYAAFELEFWRSAQASGRAADYEEYLRQYPDGRFAGLARNRLAEVRSPAAPAQTKAAAPPAPPAPPVPSPPAPAPAAQAALAPPPAAAPAGPAQPAVGIYPPLPAPGTVFRDCADCPELVSLPGGSFLLGSPPSEFGRSDEEGPQRAVTVRPFAAGRFEVTRAEYGAFARATGRRAAGGCVVWNPQTGEWKADAARTWLDPGFPQSERDPVVCVSWQDAKAYAAWLARRTGRPYRLLAEAEWEYAARAGTASSRPWGELPDQACFQANVADFSARGVGGPNALYHNCNDGRTFTGPVGSHQRNGFGLHDMIGNVWEWVEDCWNPNHAGAPADGAARLSGDCSKRTQRGGGWSNGPALARSATRLWSGVGERAPGLGLRVARGN